MKEPMLYRVIRRPLGAIFKAIYKPVIVGKRFIPESGRIILAGNHTNYFDCILVGCATKRCVHFLAKDELMKGPLKFIFKGMGIIPVNRRTKDKAALESAIATLNDEKLIGIFPEGTRSKDYKPARAKSGVAMIANKAKAPVLPVSIYNCDEMKKKSKITVRFGELIPYENLGMSEEATREETKACAKMIMSEIVKLWEMGHCE